MPIRRTTELLAAAALAAALALPATASSPKPPKPLKPTQFAVAGPELPVLAEGEALIAFALDAESGVEWLKLQPVEGKGEDQKHVGKPLTIKLQPETGYTVRVFRVRAAKYKLEMIKAEGAYGGRVRMNLKEPFTVDAGQLNYIGDIKLKRHDLHVDVWVFNRVGRFSGKLLETNRAIAEGFKLRYAGEDADDWSSTIFEGE